MAKPDTWKQTKRGLWFRCDDFSVSDHGSGHGWTAARPEGFMLRDGTTMNDIRRFVSGEEARAFVDRYHRIREDA